MELQNQIDDDLVLKPLRQSLPNQCQKHYQLTIKPTKIDSSRLMIKKDTDVNYNYFTYGWVPKSQRNLYVLTAYVLPHIKYKQQIKALVGKDQSAANVPWVKIPWHHELVDTYHP